MAPQSTHNTYVLGIDVGDARIGLAVSSSIARLPRPIETIQRDQDVFDRLNSIISREDVSTIAVGIPRNLSGEETAQSRAIRNFAQEIEDTTKLPMVFVDESLSTQRADQWLKDNKSSSNPQDSVAACFILEEYLDTMEKQ